MVVFGLVVQECILFWVVVRWYKIKFVDIEVFGGCYVFYEEDYVIYFNGCGMFIDWVGLVVVWFVCLCVYCGVLYVDIVFGGQLYVYCQVVWVSVIDVVVGVYEVGLIGKFVDQVVEYSL